MKLGCLLLGVGLLSCGTVKEADPLASSVGFCEEWAKRACSEAVVQSCEADDKEECRKTQATFCEKLVPSTLYSQDGADECLEFVETAYKDGNLDAADRDAVRSLGAPCDRVLSGDGVEGDDCRENSDCDRIAGFDCVIGTGEIDGTCQKPVSVRGGSSCGDKADVCEEGTYCDDASKRCYERSNAGDPCSDKMPCAKGLNCEMAPDAGVGVCKAKLAKGERGCEVDSDCATGICQSSNGRSICSTMIDLGPLEVICDDLR